MSSSGELLMATLSERILQSIDNGAVAVVSKFDGWVMIYQFERDELDEALRIFGPYFRLFFLDKPWAEVFRSAFELRLAPGNVSTILITHDSVEAGVCFRRIGDLN